MRRVKFIIFVLILILSIGFAAINYTLSLDGEADLTGDLEDFKVYFSDVSVNGVKDYSVVESDTKLSFSNTLDKPGSTYTIEYEVTNGSRYFDAQVSMNCTNGNEYLGVTNEFDTTSNLGALESREGTLTLKKLKSKASENSEFYNITCDIVATPVERESVAEGVPPLSLEYMQLAMVQSTSIEDESMFRVPEYREYIKIINFQNEINVPDDAIESWDIGITGNGNVMAYIVENENDPNYYDLYIQSNEQLYANPDMTGWFYNFVYLDEINGLELLDTRYTQSMAGIFAYTGVVSEVFTLDVSHFDTSNVTDMNSMFYATGRISYDFQLDVSGFNTSNVTDMGSMFSNTKLTDIDLSNFDTSKVTDMSGMFSETSFEGLDISSFDTSNVTDMNNMFSYSCFDNIVVGDFDTSKVTDMGSMFSESCGCDDIISKLDTSNVTYMGWMFYYYNLHDVDLSHFDTSNVTDMSHMFSQSYFSNLDLSDFDTSNVTNMEEMFLGAGYGNEVNLILGDNFDTSKVVNMNRTFMWLASDSTKLNTEITIRNPNIENYEKVFSYLATKEGSKFTVNYTSETEALVNDMIASKSDGSNVVKGTLKE